MGILVDNITFPGYSFSTVMGITYYQVNFLTFSIMYSELFPSRGYVPVTARGTVIDAIFYPHPADDFSRVHLNELDHFGLSVECDAFKSDDWDERKINFLENEEVFYCGDKLLPWSMQPQELRERFTDFTSEIERAERWIRRRTRLLDLCLLALPRGLRGFFSNAN